MLTRKNVTIRDNFNAIARRYDLTNRVISLGIDVLWRKTAVRTLGDAPADATVLDLACGTCDMSLELIRQRPNAEVVGADLSAEMLQHGKDKLARAPGGDRGRVRLVNAQAELLPFVDRSFDAAMIAFGIRNVPDFPAGLRELARVLRPGGRLCVLEFSTPPTLFAGLYGFYFFHVLPLIGGLITGRPAAYRYLTESVARFPGAGAFRDAMREAGFADVRYRRLTGGIVCVHTGVRP